MDVGQEEIKQTKVLILVTGEFCPGFGTRWEYIAGGRPAACAGLE